MSTFGCIKWQDFPSTDSRHSWILAELIPVHQGDNKCWLCGWRSAHCWEKAVLVLQGEAAWISWESMPCRDEIQASSQRKRKGQEHRTRLWFPGSGLVCRARSNSQGHGAVNSSTMCPPSRGREGLSSLLRKAAMWLVMVQGHRAHTWSQIQKDASIFDVRAGSFAPCVHVPI